MGRSKHAPGAAKTLQGVNHDGRICSSGKVCFETQEEARGAAMASRLSSRTDLATYQCDECGKHHHTHQLGGKTDPLPPLRSRSVTQHRLERVISMLKDVDALAVSALASKTGIEQALEMCRIVEAEARPVRESLIAEGIRHPRKDSIAGEFMALLHNVELRRRALARRAHQ